LLLQQAFGAVSRFNQAHAFLKMGPVGSLMADHFLHQFDLLRLQPLCHMRIKRMVDATIEPIEVHVAPQDLEDRNGWVKRAEISPSCCTVY